MKERRSDIRKQLLRRDGPGCQAETHQEDCSCLYCNSNRCQSCKNINIDHFSGKAIARELGWNHRQIERLENKQMLSLECHAAKDDISCDTVDELRWQKRGHFIGFGEHKV